MVSACMRQFSGDSKRLWHMAMGNRKGMELVGERSI